MKKTFFMIGILAALSITAFGAEVGSVTKEIGIIGTAVKGITITSSKLSQTMSTMSFSVWESCK